MFQIKIIHFIFFLITTFHLLGEIGLSNSGNRRILDSSTSKNQSELRKGKYKMTNPLLDCITPQKSSLRSMINIESKIKKEALSVLDSHLAVKVSVYYRELNNGHWVGLEENEKYSPASLLKVPILIAAFKQEEKTPGFLKRVIKVDTLINNYIQILGNNNFALELDKSYTIEEILEFMIIYSDNHSKDIILKNMDQDILENVFYDLGIDIFKYKNFERSISVKEYASYYRILYNSTYLTVEHSENALNILTKTRFRLGIIAGIPDSVIVAHKFGERNYGDNRQKQLHDCGIVYSQGTPYIICIMAVGYDFINLEKVIKKISRLIFIENQSEYKKNKDM